MIRFVMQPKAHIGGLLLFDRRAGGQYAPGPSAFQFSQPCMYMHKGNASPLAHKNFVGTGTLRFRIKIDPYRNERQIPINSGIELDPRVPRKPSFSSRGPRTWYTLFSKNGWVTIRSSLCFELEQIRGHFYFTNFLFFYNKSGVRFDITQSIVTL